MIFLSPSHFNRATSAPGNARPYASPKCASNRGRKVPQTSSPGGGAICRPRLILYLPAKQTSQLTFANHTRGRTSLLLAAYLGPFRTASNLDLGDPNRPPLRRGRSNEYARVKCYDAPLGFSPGHDIHMPTRCPHLSKTSRPAVRSLKNFSSFLTYIPSRIDANLNFLLHILSLILLPCAITLKSNMRAVTFDTPSRRGVRSIKKPTNGVQQMS